MVSKPKRKYRKPTPDRLVNVALHYLSRYAASEASLRRVLENRIRRAAMQDEAFAADYDAQNKLKEAINDIVEKHKLTGAINDEAYAEMKVRSMRRSGGSARKISLKMHQKGIAPKLTGKALEKAAEEDPTHTEEEAAKAFAKRRRFGSYRPQASWDKLDDEQKRKRREKDQASMARADFSFDVIRDVLGE